MMAMMAEDDRQRRERAAVEGSGVGVGSGSWVGDSAGGGMNQTLRRNRESSGLPSSSSPPLSATEAIELAK